MDIPAVNQTEIPTVKTNSDHNFQTKQRSLLSKQLTCKDP